MTGDTAPPPPAAAEEVPPPTFDLSKKKKKKKPKSSDAPAAELSDSLAMLGLDPSDAGPVEEEPVDFALPDFAGSKKKKKKKKAFFDDDLDADGAVISRDADGVRTSRREVAPQPWDGDDRDYTYSELINRAFQFLHGKNPSLATAGSKKKKISLQLPQVAREGTKKTVFINFGSICKSIHRQQDHLLQYMSAELGTTGNIQIGGGLVMKGRFGAEGIANVLKRYMVELYFVSCESCGAKRSVAAIRQGFMARVERRKKK